MVGSITSFCSGHASGTGLERAAEIEPILEVGFPKSFWRSPMTSLWTVDPSLSLAKNPFNQAGAILIVSFTQMCFEDYLADIREFMQPRR